MHRAPALTVLTVGVLSGCAPLTQVNPFVDDAPPSGTVYTASSQRLAELWIDEPTQLNDRGWAPMEYAAKDGQVAHWPLWWEDSFEDSGSENNRFAWSAEDYLALVWCPARAAVNTVALPVSAVVDPPWAVRCSDGRISPQTFGMSLHDASSCE